MNIDTFGISENTSRSTSDTFEDSNVENDLHAIKKKIENRKLKQKRLKMIFGGLLLLIMLLICFAAYSQYRVYQLSKEESGQVGVSSPIDINKPEEILKALRRHILVPEGNPQIAEIQDAARLKETQAFFKDAVNGDIVIVYETMIYIYRPSADIVVASDDISGVGQQNP